MRKLFLTLLGAFIWLTAVYAQQGYKIQVQVNGAQDGQIILGHHRSGALIPDDTAKANNKGYAVFQGKKKLRKGLYLIFLPNKTYFDIIMGDDQDFTVMNDTSDLYKNIKVKGSLDNQIFIDYQNFMDKNSQKAKKIEEKYKQAKTDKEKEKYRKQLKEIQQEWIDYVNGIVKKYPNLYVSKFLKGLIPVETPDSITDPLKRYLWMKNHFFDNFNIGDPDLFYTPFYEKKIDQYLDNVIVQHPDSLNQAVDYILAQVRPDKEMYKYTLIHLFNKYARSQLMIAENVYTHLAEIYIRDATWSDKDFIKRLKTRIARKKNCLIGEQAQPLHLAVLPADSSAIEQLRIPLKAMKQKGLKIQKQKPNFNDRVGDLSELIAEYMGNFPQYIDLYKVQAKYTVLWFMDPECSHCRAETPQLFNIFVKDLRDKDVAVIDIYLARNTDDWARFCAHIGKWFTFVEKHKLYSPGWINAWNPFANSRFKYDINATPKVYLLDKDKKIIAKNIGPEQIKEIIYDMEGLNKDGTPKKDKKGQTKK